MSSGFDLTNMPGSAEQAVSERTQTLVPVRCAVCGTDNPPGEEWCIDCGFQLGTKPGEPPVVSEGAPRLVDENTNREFQLVAGENGIGREGPEIILTDKTVSRRHAKIIVDDEGLWLEDLGSSNGTKVNGDNLLPGERRRLKNGQLLTFGSAVMKLLVPGMEEDLGLADESGTAVEPAAWLIEVDGTEYAVPASSVTIGRKSGNAVVIQDDPYMSGIHGQILYENGTFSYIDLGSTNGSLINDRRAIPDQPVQIHDGDRLTLGHTVFTFRIGNPHAVCDEKSETGEQEPTE